MCDLEKERFNKDFNVNDKIVRERQKEQIDRFYQTRLNKRMDREETRWQN